MTDDMNGEIYMEPPFQAVIIPPESTASEPETVFLVPESADPVPEEPETAPSSSGEVVSVDELLERLSQTEQNTGDTPEMSAEDTGTTDDVPVYSETGGIIAIEGMGQLLQRLETLEQTADHPMMETPFESYTVTEGLLLLIFILLFLDFFLNLLRRWF